MTANDAVDQLEAEWDLELGFLGNLRQGKFDPVGYDRFVTMLSSVEELGETVDRRFVALTWYIPLFMQWQKERCVEHGHSDQDFDRAVNRVTGILERVLGTP